MSCSSLSPQPHLHAHEYTWHKYTCVTASHESVFSHPHQKHTDKVVDMRLHNHQPTSYQCHPPTHPQPLPPPRTPISSRSCVPGALWSPQAVRGLSFLQAVSLSWHILECHQSAVTPSGAAWQWLWHLLFWHGAAEVSHAILPDMGQLPKD